MRGEIIIKKKKKTYLNVFRWGQVPQDGGRGVACVHTKGSPEQQVRWRCVREARREGRSSWEARDDVAAIVLHQLEKGKKKTDPSCLRGDGGWVACVCLPARVRARGCDSVAGALANGVEDDGGVMASRPA